MARSLVKYVIGRPIVTGYYLKVHGYRCSTGSYLVAYNDQGILGQPESENPLHLSLILLCVFKKPESSRYSLKQSLALSAATSLEMSTMYQ